MSGNINVFRLSRVWEDGRISAIKNTGASTVTVVTQFSSNGNARCTVNTVSDITALMALAVSDTAPAAATATAQTDFGVN